MEQEKYRVFVPNAKEQSGRKRRRSIHGGQDNTVRQRIEVYRELWSPVQSKIDDVLNQVHEKTIKEVDQFLALEASKFRHQNVVPTGLVVAGPSLTSRSSFFDQLRASINGSKVNDIVVLNSGSCPNLKALLREVTRAATSSIAVDDEDDGKKNETRLFDYDLESLRQWHAKTSSQHVVVVFQDSEAFDSATLIQAVSIFHSWLDRIPFVLLFGIGTSTDTFQERLPASTLRLLKGEKFEIADTAKTLQQVFLASVEGPGIRLRIGSTLTDRLIEAQNDHVQSLETFCDALKYAYMLHFYENSVSLLLSEDLEYKQIPKQVFEGVRNLPSFRRWAERQLDHSETNSVQKSLNSDIDLFELMQKGLQTSNTAFAQIVAATSCIATIQGCNRQSTTGSPPRSELYSLAMSGKLPGSPLIRDLMMFVRKASSDILIQIFEALLERCKESLPINVSNHKAQLEELLLQNSDVSGPLKSQHSETLRATVVSQKIQLSKQKATLSKVDAAYSSIVDSFHSELSAYFDKVLVNPTEIFLHEILIYDRKDPHSKAFLPRPRFGIERALFSPHDYLNCKCCPSIGDRDGEHDNFLAATQPATSILYQLYLESGSLINVSDLWSAYYSIVGQEDEEDEKDLSSHQALFQRGLAELKYLGMIKLTKKKADHIAKASWRGL